MWPPSQAFLSNGMGYCHGPDPKALDLYGTFLMNLTCASQYRTTCHDLLRNKLARMLCSASCANQPRHGTATHMHRCPARNLFLQ